MFVVEELLRTFCKMIHDDGGVSSRALIACCHFGGFGIGQAVRLGNEGFWTTSRMKIRTRVY